MFDYLHGPRQHPDPRRRGHTVTADTGSEYGNIAGLACVLGDIDTPDAIVSQMDATTAMMGAQTAEFEDFHYVWSYHPDNGINMTITED